MYTHRESAKETLSLFLSPRPLSHCLTVIHYYYMDGVIYQFPGCHNDPNIFTSIFALSFVWLCV